jgi:hypothetical protein
MFLNINSERAVVIYSYIRYGDIISKLGGLKAALTPIIGILTPLMMLYFLLLLAGIIQETDAIQYRDELLKAVKLYSKEEVQVEGLTDG